MSPYVVLGIVLGVVALVLVAVYFAVPYAIKKGWNIEKYLQSADKGIDAVQDTLGTVSKVIPIPHVDLVNKILDYADKAVAQAEQLYKIGEVQADGRKDEAKAYILNILNVAGIEVTSEMEKVIDGAIEASVYVLPKTSDVVVLPSDSEVVSAPASETPQQ